MNVFEFPGVRGEFVTKEDFDHLTAQNEMLVAALEEMMEYAGIIEERCDSVATDKARAALAAVKEKL